MGELARMMPWALVFMLVLYITASWSTHSDTMTGLPVHREAQVETRWEFPATDGARGRPARITAAQAGGSDTNGGRGPGSGWSLDESLGWFDEPDGDWKYRKSHVKEQLKFRKFYPQNSTQQGLRVKANDNSVMFQMDWRPILECPEMVTLQNVHNMEAKYLCGAIRLKNAKKCVVYSIGSRGEFSFEELVHDLNPNCEIHVFDPAPEFANSSSTPAFIRYNAVGLASTSDGDLDPVQRRRMAASNYQYETLSEMMARLGHDEIDVLKIDCDGCEYKMYEQLGKINCKQLLIEIHRYPNKNEGPEWEGYVRMMDSFYEYGYIPVAREMNAAYPRKPAGGEMQVWAAEYVYVRMKRGIFA